MSIKKQYQTIHAMLTDITGTKLTKAKFAELEKLMTSKTMAKTFKKDEDGNVTHVYCYYHKEWEDVSEVPYGAKASTAHGYNTMCKQGVSNWTRQQRLMKQAKADLLEDIANGKIEATDLAGHIAKIEEEAKTIVAL